MARIHRQDVPIEEQWRLGDIFPTEQAWDQAYQSVVADLPAMVLLSTSMARSAADLLAALDARDAMLARLNRVVYYANCRVTEDSTDTNNQIAMGRAGALWAQTQGHLTDFQVRLLALPTEQLDSFVAQEPALGQYHRFLEDLAELRTHSLSPEAESALSAVNRVLSAPASLYHTVTAADMKFAPAQDSQGASLAVSLFSYMTQVETSPDNTLRRSAYRSLVQALTPYQHGLAATLRTEIEKNVAMARLRRYPSAPEMLLRFPGSDLTRAADRVPVESFHMILDLIQQELALHMQRYARLRKRVLGLDRLLFCDVKAPLDPGFDPRISFETASEMIIAGAGALGAEYQATMRRAFTERWVYRADNEGRGMIAFGGGVHGVHGYSFYPWGGNLFDAFLLGHELGHSVHFDLAMQHQKMTNMIAPLFFVEAPSTLIEHLMVKQVRRSTNDPRLHRWLNMYLLMSYHHNFVTHILEAELLRRLYAMAEAGRPLTTTLISGTKREILAAFWGDTVEMDDGAALTWMRQPHYYSGLYPYTYSVGLSASTVLAERIAREGKPAGEAWVEVLKQGGSRRATDLFAMVGLDMTAPDPYREAVAYVGTLLDELEQAFADS